MKASYVLKHVADLGSDDEVAVHEACQTVLAGIECMNEEHLHGWCRKCCVMVDVK